ncbi:MAG: dihydrolipoyl dehydrogenase family protein [Alphaproteobacteria bacterium]
MKKINVDICVIGGGAGGLSVAAGAVQMGATVALIEKGLMGGDCLNYGCVPSKALLSAGKAAHAVTANEELGVHAKLENVNFARANQHVHDVIAGIAPHDSQERFEGLGVQVFRDFGKFTSATEVQAGDTSISAKKFVVATGSSPFVPPIPGLDTVPYLTNENVFELKEAPKHLIIIGGGPIGCELAQAHARLGSKVTVLEMANIMAKDDQELVNVVRGALTREGINLLEKAKVTQIAKHEDGVSVSYELDGQTLSVEGSTLLMAVGRKANLDGLDLEKAGIDYTRAGITVDARLRSTNKRVFAIGDVAGGFQFTHIAGYHAGIIIRNILFKLPAKVDYKAVPWVTYTEPEMANVGMNEDMAKANGLDYQVLKFDYAEMDRARSEGITEGMIKVIVGKKGLILGCGIAGKGAGELLLPWSLAIQNKMKIGAIAGLIAPYPTMSEISKRVAGTYYTKSLFSERTKKVVRFLMKLPF